MENFQCFHVTFISMCYLHQLCYICICLPIKANEKELHYMPPLSALLPQIDSVFFFQYLFWNEMKANLWCTQRKSTLDLKHMDHTANFLHMCIFRSVRRKNLSETYLLQSTLRNLNAAIFVLYQLLVLVAEATTMGSWITIVIRLLASNYSAMLLV